MAFEDCMIAYLPEDGSWCKQELPHMTLVYGGPIQDRPDSDLNAMAKDAISAARITGPFSLPVTAVEQMGEGEDEVDVLILYPNPQLLLARSLVKHWNNSEFPDFKPHATIGPAGSAFAEPDAYSNSVSWKSNLPDRLYFDRVAVCWGDKKLVFRSNSF